MKRMLTMSIVRIRVGQRPASAAIVSEALSYSPPHSSPAGARATMGMSSSPSPRSRASMSDPPPGPRM